MANKQTPVVRSGGPPHAPAEARAGCHPTREWVHSELDRLQFGSDDARLVVRQLPIGYGGQITGRIIGLKLALALRRKAIFLRDDDPPYTQSLVCPFSGSEEFRSADTVPHMHLFGGDPRPIVSFDYLHAQRVLANGSLTVENWIDDVLDSRFAQFDFWKDHIDGWIFGWLKFLPQFESRLETDRLRLGMSSSALGVHFRRGDKTVESAYVPAGDYTAAIERIHALWTFDAVFLASDDPQAAAALKFPNGTRLIFDASEPRYNNANHRMLMANPGMAAEETYIAFKNLRLLSACGGLVGQNNAHFATIAGSFILQRDLKPERVMLIDGRIAEQRSMSLRFAYAAKRKFRALTKSVMPRRFLRSLTRVIYRR